MHQQLPKEDEPAFIDPYDMTGARMRRAGVKINLVKALHEAGKRTPRPLHDAAALGDIEPLLMLATQGATGRPELLERHPLMVLDPDPVPDSPPPTAQSLAAKKKEEERTKNRSPDFTDRSYTPGMAPQHATEVERGVALRRASSPERAAERDRKKELKKLHAYHLLHGYNGLPAGEKAAKMAVKDASQYKSWAEQYPPEPEEIDGNQLLLMNRDGPGSAQPVLMNGQPLTNFNDTRTSFGDRDVGGMNETMTSFGNLSAPNTAQGSAPNTAQSKVSFAGSPPNTAGSAGADPSIPPGMMRDPVTGYIVPKPEDMRGQTAALVAKKRDPMKILAVWVPEGYDVWEPQKEVHAHDIDETDRDGRTALHFAASFGKMDVVATLVELGADLNIGDRNGQTALHFAAAAGRAKVVDQLTAISDCDAAARDNSLQTPLHISVRSGKGKCARFLREHPSGDAASRMRDNDACVPGAYAPGGFGKRLKRRAEELAKDMRRIARQSDADSLHALLADDDLEFVVRWHDPDGRTLLHYAACHGQLQMAEDVLSAAGLPGTRPPIGRGGQLTATCNGTTVKAPTIYISSR